MDTHFCKREETKNPKQLVLFPYFFMYKAHQRSKINQLMKFHQRIPLSSGVWPGHGFLSWKGNTKNKRASVVFLF